MNIGIFTFHRAFNYGAVLQAYGLYKWLQNSGHNVHFIDYWNTDTVPSLIKPLTELQLLKRYEAIYTS